MKQSDKDLIIENANNRQFTINVKGKKYAARTENFSNEIPLSIFENKIFFLSSILKLSNSVGR